MWGHSQGGHTAMHNLRIGDSYAPELTLKGLAILHAEVAGGQPLQLNLS